MDLLRRKTDKGVSAKRRAGDGELRPAVSHRVTVGLSRAETFAAMLANSRAGKSIEISDVLGGMYLYDWDGLAQYWNEESRDAVESFLRRFCSISPQRWHYWIELYDSQKQEPKRLKSWRALQQLAFSKKSEEDEPKKLASSDPVALVYRQAEKVAPSHDPNRGRNIPILTMELILLCIVRNTSATGSEAAKKLVSLGLDVVKLERAALAPKRAPRPPSS